MREHRHDPKLLCPPDEKADREIANQQAVIEYIAYLVEQGRERITEGDILEIHRLTIDGIYPCAGQYRTATIEIKITGTRHRPSETSMVQAHVRDMLEWHYGPGQKETPILRAARVMWRINAIHPFAGGNGRVARAVAYLVITSEIAPFFAGEPLPVKLKKQKKKYISCLKAGDRGDLKPMEALIMRCMTEQLSEAFDDAAEEGGVVNKPGVAFLIAFLVWLLQSVLRKSTESSGNQDKT